MTALDKQAAQIWDFYPREDITAKEIATILVGLKVRFEGQEFFYCIPTEVQRHFKERK